MNTKYSNIALLLIISIITIGVLVTGDISPILYDTFVPYEGAVKNVDLYGYNLTVNDIDTNSTKLDFVMNKNDSTGAVPFLNVRSGDGVFNCPSCIQNFVKLEPTIDQGGTSGFYALWIDVNAVGMGSGSKRLLNFEVNSTPRFLVGLDGSIQTNNGTGGTVMNFLSSSGDLSVTHDGKSTKLRPGGGVVVTTNDYAFTSLSYPNVGFKFAGGGGGNMQVTGLTGSPQINLSIGGEIQTTGLSNDGVGRLVCIKTGGQLGTCVISGMGTCTCT